MSEVQRFLMARHSDSEYGVSLRKRRMWFADDPAQADPAKAPGDTKPPADKAEPEGEKTFSAAYVKELRDEAADWRKQFKAMKTRLDEIEQGSKTAEEKKLADQQEFKTLAEKKAAEAADWKAKFEAAEQKSLRLQIAAEFELPPAAAKRLVGTTEEELRADAKELAALIPKAPVTQETGDKKTETPADAGGKEQKGGSQPAVTPQTTTAVPGGQPKTGDTDADRKARYFGGVKQSPIFTGSRLVFNGDPTDLDK